MDIPAFRQQFPEFIDPETYTDTVIGFWVDIAGSMLPESRWGDLLEYGTRLFVAHHLVIDEEDLAAANADGIPGEVKGPVVSKSVDKVSVSRDTSAVTLTDADFWNMSKYGIRFLRLARMMGAGPIQL